MIAPVSCSAACTKPSASAAIVNSSGMMKRRASTTAIAIISSASPPPAAPRAAGRAWDEPSSNLKLRRRLEVRRHRLDRAAQLGAQLLGHEMGVDTVANDLRPDEYDELGARDRPRLMRKEIAQLGNLIKHRNARAVELGALLDQPRQQHGLAARDRHRALDLALRHGRRQRGARAAR